MMESFANEDPKEKEFCPERNVDDDDQEQDENDWHDDEDAQEWDEDDWFDQDENDWHDDDMADDIASSSTPSSTWTSPILVRAHHEAQQGSKSRDRKGVPAIEDDDWCSKDEKDGWEEEEGVEHDMHFFSSPPSVLVRPDDEGWCYVEQNSRSVGPGPSLQSTKLKEEGKQLEQELLQMRMKVDIKNAQLFRFEESVAAQQKEITQLEKALAERDEQIQRLKHEARAVEVFDVDAGVVQLEVRKNSEPQANRSCRVQNARICEISARLVKVKQEKAEVQEELLEERDERGFQIRVCTSNKQLLFRIAAACPLNDILHSDRHICAMVRQPTLSRPRWMSSQPWPLLQGLMQLPFRQSSSAPSASRGAGTPASKDSSQEPCASQAATLIDREEKGDSAVYEHISPLLQAQWGKGGMERLNRCRRSTAVGWPASGSLRQAIDGAELRGDAWLGGRGFERRAYQQRPGE